MTSVLVATPAYHGELTLPYHRAFISMMIEASARKVELGQFFTSDSFVSHSRNTAATIFLNNPHLTHLLCVDADMGWPADALFRLLDFKKPIVGGVYPARMADSNKWIWFPPEGKEVATVDGFAKVKGVGCGFLLIEREVIEVMSSAYRERTYTSEDFPGPLVDLFPSGVDENQRNTTDDAGFCRLALRLGFDIWADLATAYTHTGHQTVAKGSYLDWVAAQENSK